MPPRTPQAPIPSGLGRATTAREAVGDTDLCGKLAVVTAGHTGIGLETTRALVHAGAAVVVLARDADKARQALDGLPRTEAHALDLADPDSIDRFADVFAATGRTLDLLIANAGIMAVPLAHDARGFERQFATNHLGHFQLAARLWPALKQAGQARVVVLSSRAHHRSDIDFDDPHYQHRDHDMWQAYGQSKTANALFALGLDLQAQAHGVRAFSVHPGSILTGLQQHIAVKDLQAAGLRDADGQIPKEALGRYKTVEQGAATSVWCATSPSLEGMGGVYCEDCDIAAALTAEEKSSRGARPWICDPTRAMRLWSLSEAMTGVRFDAAG
ncbi:oxidoreductase [Hydrogenophaga sp.]|uniref:oxidoreductase n=1 Tax=Hydrogenophaga sp. TaxID=1904254 RepID=UPI002615E2BC|nr:oxidoreductase [Hydrogenophaga sp.]MCW5655474.1 SDR family NAD(P)-dependent oxidoreductase [Hydrogenophaga sp.]